MQSVRQAYGKKSKRQLEIKIDFDEIIKNVMEEANKSCPSIIQFTLQALYNDFKRGYDIFTVKYF